MERWKGGENEKLKKKEGRERRKRGGELEDAGRVQEEEPISVTGMLAGVEERFRE